MTTGHQHHGYRAALVPLGLALAYIASARWAPVSGGALTALIAFQLGLGPPGLIPLVVSVFVYRRRIDGPPGAAWAAGLREARDRGWFGDRLATFLLVFVTLPAFFWAFATWKTVIPPFTADPALASLDAALHGGPPDRWLLHTPQAIRLMHEWYSTWDLLLIGIVLWQSWGGTPRDRVRFWLAFVVTWIGLGTVLAHLVPSAGPVFYAVVTGDHAPYADLRAALHGAETRYHLGLAHIHTYLWSAVLRREVVFSGGISAFPSLHIALPVLAACAVWRVRRWVAVGFLFYTVTLLACAIGLGWHYAIDGYASMLLVPVIWWATGRVIPSLPRPT
jgi:hypothetical protein